MKSVGTLGALLLVAIPLAQSVPVIEDASNDVIADTAAGPMTSPAAPSYLDLLRLELEETEQQLTFVLVRAGAPTSAVEGGYYAIGFRFEDTEYLIRADQAATYLEGDPRHSSMQRRPVGSENWGGVAAGRVDVDGPALRTTFDKLVITDGVAVPVTRGSRLTEFWATSLDYNSNTAILGPVPPVGTAAKFHDAMPEGGPAGEFMLALGDAPNDSLRLTSLRPIRSSNGEQTTIVYDVTVTNPQDVAVEVSFTTSDAPMGWEVTYVHQAMDLAAGEQRTMPVIVAIPFTHQHGATYGFNVTATDLQTGNVLSRLALGVHYLDVPQPAGHHDTVYVHVDTEPGQGRRPFLGSDEAGRYAYLNTLTKDERDHGLAAEPDTFATEFPLAQYGSAQPVRYTWCIDLDSTLLLGLDVDLTRQGLWTVTFASGTATTGTLTGRLLATATAGDAFQESTPCSDAPALALASIAAAPIALTGQGDAQSMELAVLPLVDELAFAQGRRLVWEANIDLEANPSTPYQVDYPVIKPGSSIVLPLNEYHENPPAYVDDGVRFILGSPSRTLRNPGGVAVFNLTLDGAAGAFGLSLHGTNKDWASLTRHRVREGEEVSVIIRVPEDAVDGMLADVVVKAEREGGLALAHVLVEVDTAVEHSDDASLARSLRPAQQAPSVQPGLLGVALLILLGLVGRGRAGPDRTR